MDIPQYSAYFVGFDDWGRPVFKIDNLRAYYCVTEVNFEHNPLRQEDLEGRAVVWKGHHFDDEPNYPVSNVQLYLQR